MKKNKIKLMTLLLTISVMFFTSCQDDDFTTVALTDFELGQTDMQLNVGEVQAIVAKAIPENATENITWTSSNNLVAEIQYNDRGLVAGVKGISLGVAVLTAKSSTGAIIKTITVGVIVKVESILLVEVPSANPSKTSFNVVFTPANATIKTVEWKSSNPGVISVDQSGNVTAISPGSATITATTTQGAIEALVQLSASGSPVILGLQYCTITGTGGYNADTVVTTGAVDDINYSGTQPSNNYEFSNDKLIVSTDTKITISLTQSNNWSKSKIWIDWNSDKDFDDAGELVVNFGSNDQLNNGPFNATINVPANAFIGTTRMRIQTLDAWVNSGLCGAVPNQTTKDFEVEVLGVTYCSISGTGGYNADSVITTGAESNLNYSGSQPAGNYQFYTAETLGVSTGKVFNLSLVQSNNWSKSKVWIDWNADGDFEDSDELVINFGLDDNLNNGPFSGSVTVPNNATKGNTRMRIQTLDAWVNYGLCGLVKNQTTKDFKVKVF